MGGDGRGREEMGREGERGEKEMREREQEYKESSQPGGKERGGRRRRSGKDGGEKKKKETQRECQRDYDWHARVPTFWLSSLTNSLHIFVICPPTRRLKVNAGYSRQNRNMSAISRESLEYNECTCAPRTSRSCSSLTRFASAACLTLSSRRAGGGEREECVFN